MRHWRYLMFVSQFFGSGISRISRLLYLSICCSLSQYRDPYQMRYGVHCASEVRLVLSKNRLAALPEQLGQWGPKPDSETDRAMFFKVQRPFLAPAK